MIIACPACESRFNVDPARLPSDGRVVKCSKCGYRWRVDAGGNPVAEPVTTAGPELPAGPSAREILARHAEAAATAAAAEPEPIEEPAQETPPELREGVAPDTMEAPVEAETEAEVEAGRSGMESMAAESGGEAAPTPAAETAPGSDSTVEGAPTRPDLAGLTPRQRQKLQHAQKGGSRVRVLVLFLLVLVSVVALVGLMKKGPQIERALQQDAQSVRPVPAEPPAQPAPPAQTGGQ